MSLAVVLVEPSRKTCIVVFKDEKHPAYFQTCFTWFLLALCLRWISYLEHKFESWLDYPYNSYYNTCDSYNNLI